MSKNTIRRRAFFFFIPLLGATYILSCNQVDKAEKDDDTRLAQASPEAFADAVGDSILQKTTELITSDKNQAKEDSSATISKGHRPVVSKLKRFGRALLGGNQDEKNDNTRPEQASPEASADAVGDSILQKTTELITSDKNQAKEDSSATISKGHRPVIFQRLGWALFGGYQHYKGGDIRPKLRSPEATADAVGDRIFGLRISWRIQQPMHVIVTYEAADMRLEDEVFGAIRSQHRSVNCAAQYFMGAYTATRPYASIGLGVHDLSFSGPSMAIGNSRRLGVDLGVGFEHFFGSGWKILGETSYQRVRRRNDPATSSNYRLSIGIGYGASM
jgi:hypothetical protein